MMRQLRLSFRSWAWGLFMAVLAVSHASAWGGVSLPKLAWPAIQWPAGVRHFPIAHTLALQGMPMHIHGFTSNHSPHELAVELQKQYGQQLIPTVQEAGVLLLGKEEGPGYFLNFRIKPGHQSLGSQGEVTLTPTQPIHGYVQQHHDDSRWWGQHLPPSHRLLQYQVSFDSKQQAIYLVIESRGSVTNFERAIASALALQGLQSDASSAASSHAADGPAYFVRNDQATPHYQSLQGSVQSATVLVNAGQAGGKHSAIVNVVFSREVSP